jgi:hypothetical protein
MYSFAILAWLAAILLLPKPVRVASVSATGLAASRNQTL